MFQYKYFTESVLTLDGTLNYWGAEGWRLHTCEPVTDKFGYRAAFVVMDRLVVSEEDEQGESDTEEPAMKMR